MRVVGQEAVIELMLVALLARGHALLVGVPGLAKTLLVASLAEVLDLSFGRVQFTPDLLPADITGTDVLQEDADAHGPSAPRRSLHAGADLPQPGAGRRDQPHSAEDAGRAAAGDAGATRDGRQPDARPARIRSRSSRRAIPSSRRGRTRLPEAQLDRFLLEVHIDYPNAEEEREIARRTTGVQVAHVPRVLASDDVRALQALIPRMPVTDAAVDLAVALARATRPGDPQAPPEVRELVRFGAGPARAAGPRARVEGARRAARRGGGRRGRRARRWPSRSCGTASS